MIKHLLLFAALMMAAAVAVPAKAADLPVRETLGITNTAPSQLDMPAFQGNGQLVLVQVTDDRLTNNTCVVRHIAPVSGSSRKITNTVVTLAYSVTPGVRASVTNGPYLIAGDSLTYTFGTSSTGLVSTVRTLAK